jgi:uncharacterized protein
MRPNPTASDEGFDDMDDFLNRSNLNPVNRPRPNRLFRIWPVAILIAALLFVWPMWAGFHTNWLWFEQLGYQSVFTTTLAAKAMLGAVAGLVTAAILWINFRLARRLSPGGGAARPVRFVEVNGQQIPAPDFSKLADRIAIPVSLVAGVFAGLTGWGAWETFLRFRHRTAFGQGDPIFGRDISFYFFTLPVMEALARWLFLLVIVCLAGAVLIYVVRGAVEFGQSRASFRLRPGARV